MHVMCACVVSRCVKACAWVYVCMYVCIVMSYNIAVRKLSLPVSGLSTLSTCTVQQSYHHTVTVANIVKINTYWSNDWAQA